MVIEQYTNNLHFQVSIGVRIAKPLTLESAIVIARQEEARLAYNKVNFNYSTPSTSAQAKFKEPTRNPNQNQNISSNKTPEQHWPKPTVPWKNRPLSGNFRTPSGNFRPNVPQQQVKTPQKVSDVTMRSLTKPQKPQFASEQLFYAEAPEQFDQPYEDNSFENQQGEYQYCIQQEYEPSEGEPHQNFYQDQDLPDQS